MPQETQSKTDLCGLLTGLVLLVTLVARVESHCDSALLISWFVSFNGLIFNSSRPIHSWFVWDGVHMFAITCFFFCCLEDKKWELKREAAWTWTSDSSHVFACYCPPYLNYKIWSAFCFPFSSGLDATGLCTDCHLTLAERVFCILG